MRQKKHLKNLREYVEALRQIGELQPIAKQVDLHLEIGAICRRCYETGSPAPLFENIKDVEPGFRVLGAPAGVSAQPGLYLSRIALSLGLDPKATGREIVESLVEARTRKPIPPKIVPTGPCKEHILTGQQIDLTHLPAPWLHGGDGGRYLNTFGIVVARTPDGRWTNWSIARIMVLDRNRMAGIVAPNQHIGMVAKEWWDRGQDMPFALALGCEPFIPFVGGMPLPADANEADYVGAYFDEPVEVVRCETVDLEVPATTEIVVEGHLSRTERDLEGPMGEYAGYLWTGPPSPKPVYLVTAITHRSDPILPVSVAGEPVEEDHTAWGIPNAAEIVFELREKGFPVATAWSPLESANHWYAIAMDMNWREHLQYGASKLCEEMGKALFATKAGMGIPKYMIFNDDIDLSNTKELVWAFATRNYPGPRGESVFDHTSTNPLVAFLRDAEKMSMETTKVVYNCLPPDEWNGRLPKRSSFAGSYPRELQEQILRDWKEYGFRS
ncbi:MAG: UbiD family decarboxylase [Acidobacteriaceae bacterium]|nr:UbiD family decarboxylase [Acidobacteriaceae bacterium]